MKSKKESSIYRKIHLRGEFDMLIKAFFLATTTGSHLDLYANLYTLCRLQGIKPIASYRFQLTTALSFSVLIPKGSILIDDEGLNTGILLEDIKFEPYINVLSAKVELQEFIFSSEANLTKFQTPLLHIKEIKKEESFSGGADIESDESLRARILISMVELNTAGSKMNYKSYTYCADAQIKDVMIFNDLSPIDSYVNEFVQKDEEDTKRALRYLFSEFFTVKVILYAPFDTENRAITRVEEVLNSRDVRPLTDRLKVLKAKEIKFNIIATLYIFPKENIREVYADALSSLEEGLNTLQKIGVDIIQSDINNFLKIKGIQKVEVVAPLDIIIDRESIAIVDKINITPRV